MTKDERPRRVSVPWLQIGVHGLGGLPLARILFDALTGGLSVNPIQDITQRLGRAALYLLIACLAVTPLNTLLGWRALIRHRRALGLYAFLYAALHFTMFAAVDYGLDLQEISRQTVEKPYILMGITAGSILLALAITSFKWWMRQMGKGWQSLHRLVYLAGIVVIIHYAWAKKGNLFTLSGDILAPLLWGLLLVILLVLRLPAIRKWASGLRHGRPGKNRPALHGCSENNRQSTQQ
jgi:sulfoxide reductase heme-binding subunit YedZ